MTFPLEISSRVMDGADPRNREMDPSGAAHVETRHGFFAVIDEMTPRRGRRGRVAGPGMPLDAAQRAIHGFFAESPRSPGAASLRALVERVACAVRQVYEALWVERFERWDYFLAPEVQAAVNRSDGRGFIPNPGVRELWHPAGGPFALSGAFLWMDGRTGHVAASGDCAAVLIREGRIEPLHVIGTLGAQHPERASALPHDEWILKDALGYDAKNLLGELSERTVALEQGDAVALLSPAIAVPLVHPDRYRQLAVPATGAEGIAQWMAGQVASGPDMPASLSGRGVVVVARVAQER